MAEYIEREAVCKECIHCEVCDYWEKEAYPNDCEYNDGEPCEYFKSAADVAPVTKQGKWIPNPIMVSDLDGDWIALELHCSLCNRLTYHKEKYCPECGAQMEDD